MIPIQAPLRQRRPWRQMLYPCVSVRCTRARARSEFARQGMSVDPLATRCSPCCVEKLGKAEHARRNARYGRGTGSALFAQGRSALSHGIGTRDRAANTRAQIPRRYGAALHARCRSRHVSKKSSRRVFQHPGLGAASFVERAAQAGPRASKLRMKCLGAPALSPPPKSIGMIVPIDSLTANRRRARRSRETRTRYSRPRSCASVLMRCHSVRHSLASYRTVLHRVSSRCMRPACGPSHPTCGVRAHEGFGAPKTRRR